MNNSAENSRNYLTSMLIRNIIVSAISLLFAMNVYSQEIGAAPVKIWSDNREIGNPMGFSISYLQPIGVFGARIEYVYAQNTRNYYGYLNGGFLIAPDDYIQDSISSTTGFQAIEISLLLPGLFELYQNQFNIGAGITFDKLNREKSGLTTGKTYTQSENKTGLFYCVSISRGNIFNLPVKLELLFTHKALMEGNYATDSEQPFTGAIDVKELQLNAAYVF